jgi:hypothetical protein
MSTQSTPSAPTAYPARLEVDYTVERNRVTTLFRLVLVIPIAIVYGALTAGATSTVYTESGKTVSSTSGGIVAGLFVATLLMILFRQRYPRWWFDFARELTRFAARVGAYVVLLTDDYPSTVEEQRVHLDIDYPDAEQDLNRWLPLVKWFLAIPHYIVLAILGIGVYVILLISVFVVLFTGKWNEGMRRFVVGWLRWGWRVTSYVTLLRDEYPPFSLD